MVGIIVKAFEDYQLYNKAIVCSFYPWVIYKVKRASGGILTGKGRKYCCTPYEHFRSILFNLGRIYKQGDGMTLPLPIHYLYLFTINYFQA